MYQTIHKQESSAGTKKIQTKLFSSVKSGIPMNDVKPCYNFTHPVQLYALEFTQSANALAASDQERHHYFQKAQPAKNLSVQKSGIIQRQYYDASINNIKKRPPETREIRKAKINTLGMTLTAHHIIPWEKLKGYIETAFQINSSVPNTFLTLEAFANKKFPIDKQEFIESIESRMENYHRYEYTIDDWIQHVCWNPKNIFIGPLANNRVDDPGKRTGDQATSIDAHYAQPNRKSSRSEELTSFHNFDLNRRDRKTIGHMEQNITAYNPSEWMSYTLNNKKYYYQKNDPYFDSYVQARYLYDASITKISSEQAITKEMEISGDDASITKISSEQISTGITTKYRILFYTLYNFSIRDLTFRLNKNNQSPVNYLYKNSAVNNDSYDISSYIIAIPIPDNFRRYDISFEIPGINAMVYDLKAVIINNKGRSVDCPIQQQS